MTTLFIVIGCIAGFNAIYLFFYIMDDIVSQIRKISKPKKQTADFTFLDDLDDLEDEPEKPEKPETFEIYDISSLTEDDDSMPELSPNALKSLRSYDVRRFIKEEMYWLKDYILDELSRFEMESLTLLFSSYIKYLIRTGQEEDKEPESLAAEPVQEITVQEPELVSAPDNGCVPDPAISVESMTHTATPIPICCR